MLACVLSFAVPASGNAITSGGSDATSPIAAAAREASSAPAATIEQPATAAVTPAPAPQQGTAQQSTPAEGAAKTPDAGTAVGPDVTNTAPAVADGPPPVATIGPLYGPDPLPAAPAPETAPEAAPEPTQREDTGVGGAAAMGLVPDDNTAAIRTVFNAINNYRASLGLAPVKYHATVAGLAQDWSDNIATREVIEHRASFWTDPRALNPNNGAGEVIAVRWDRDAAQLVEWWKSSPGHDAMLKDPRFNVMGAGITYTDGNWQTTPNRYTMWGVVNFFGYTTLPAGTTDAPGGAVTPPTPPAPSVCDLIAKHQPPTLDLSSAAIRGPGDLVAVDSAGALLDFPALGNGQFGPARTAGTGFGGTKEVFVTDWDRDGVFDILAQKLDGTLVLHAGIQAGSFKAPLTLGSGGWQAMTMTVGTWCANNRLPQILATDSAGKLWLYNNAGMALIVRRTEVGSGVSAVRLSMVDYNADGFEDLLAVGSDGKLRLYRGAGTPAPRAEVRPVVGIGWTDYTGLRALRGAKGLNSTAIAGLDANGVVEYWDLGTGGLTTPVTVATGWTGRKLAQ
ncbi:CAP domain-containing protein [Arthrobacter cavernae]|uniref:CAP domain-containing protein n=1 Tax=Arthrobacter cavernae TaxID=2817681 RepID=A0A939HBL8_9MICC|nr:CAP domain-containing protein [Arthrobacter cavernae]MBO1267849.1 CAP domain-containing protein [Arthrobacter cavernae]